MGYNQVHSANSENLNLSFLCCGFLGGSLLWLSGLLSSWLLGGLWFLCSGLLGCWLPLWLFNLDKLEFTGSLSALLGHLQGSLLDSSLQGKTQMLTSLGSIDLVVGTHVLEDGLTGRSGSVLESSDGSSNHDGVFGVGCRSLGLGSLLCLGCVRHCDEFVVDSVVLEEVF